MEYATLIMMLVTFLQERRSSKDQNMQGLKDYLQEKNFTEVLEYLESNQQAQQGIEQLLQTEFSELSQKVDLISETLATVASKIDGFSQIAPENDNLSDDAIEILILIEDSQDPEVLYSKDFNQLILLNSNNVAITPNDPRFLHDDLENLVSLGWLTLVKHNKSGDPILSITRKGAGAAQILGGSKSNQ